MHPSSHAHSHSHGTHSHVFSSTFQFDIRNSRHSNYPCQSLGECMHSPNVRLPSFMFIFNRHRYELNTYSMQQTAMTPLHTHNMNLIQRVWTNKIKQLADSLSIVFVVFFFFILLLYRFLSNDSLAGCHFRYARQPKKKQRAWPKSKDKHV